MNDGPKVSPLASNRIVQLQSWRDVVLCLTEQGEVYAARAGEDLFLDGLRLWLVFPGHQPS